MADRIVEARNGRKEQEEEVVVPSPALAPKTALSSNPWLPLIITMAIMPALAFAMTRFVLVPQMRQALSQPVAAPAATAGTNAESSPGVIDGKPKVTYPLSKILVNVAGTMGTRYLMTSVTLVGVDDAFKSKIDQSKDQLLDLANASLSSKTITDLEKPGARNVIRAELMTVFNNALGGSVIKEIYITELAIQ